MKTLQIRFMILAIRFLVALIKQTMPYYLRSNSELSGEKDRLLQSLGFALQEHNSRESRLSQSQRKE